MKKLFIFLVVAPFISALLIGAHVGYLFTKAYDGPEVRFTIKEGEGFASINFRLAKEGVIPSARLFHYFARYKNSLNTFKQGTFLIKPGLTMEGVLDTLVNGKPIMDVVSIPEGKNLFEIADILQKLKMASEDEFLSYARNADFARTLGIQAKSLEGYLYPDTYQFNPGTDVAHIITTMVAQFKKRTAHLDFRKTGLTPSELLTLASIVEKETGASNERAIIAGVFYNRLKKKMRLQSDPTTIYGLFDRDGRFSGNIHKRDLNALTPYNTYRIAGLPPGPIANPGIAAIEATLSPIQHSYLFFVSHNDGVHEFTSTYEEHLKAVAKFQLDRRNRQGKSWRELNQN